MNRSTLLRLVQSIPSPKAEPFKLFLAQAGAEILTEVTFLKLHIKDEPVHEHFAHYLRKQLAGERMARNTHPSSSPIVMWCQ